MSRSGKSGHNLNLIKFICLISLTFLQAFSYSRNKACMSGCFKAIEAVTESRPLAAMHNKKEIHKNIDTCPNQA